MNAIKVRFLIFGMGTEIFSGSQLEFELPENSTIGDFKEKIEEDFPAVKTLGSYLLAVNQAFVRDDILLKSDDEIAFIPPVSGG